MHEMNQPEFSRPLAVDKIPAGGVDQEIEASEAERKALAARFGLLGLPRFAARLGVRPIRAGLAFAVTGRVVADAVQQCVVTLEPVPARLEPAIDVVYAPPEEAEVAASQIGLDAEETEALIGGVIDLGELAAQYLGAALDPYPRKPGVAFVEAEYGGEKATVQPFAKLAALTKTGKGKK